MSSFNRKDCCKSSMPALFLTTSAVSLMFAAPSVAVAQIGVQSAVGNSNATPADVAEVSGDIVVTANRREQSVKDVPYAISAVSGADLQRLGITDVAGLANTVPGVTFIDKGAYAGLLNNSIIIHGLNVDPTGKLVPNFSQSPVATYVNDAPVFINLHLTDLERVEILRGPQGTLYGSGSLGGTVRYLQRDADPSRYQVIATGGTGTTHNSNSLNYNGDLVVNLPITSNLAIRAQAGVTHQAGFIDLPNAYALDANRTPVLAQPGNVLGSRPVYAPIKGFNDSTIYNYRLAGFWQITDELRVRLNFNRQDTKAGGPPSITPTIFGNTLNNANFAREPISDLANIYSADVSYDLGFATLTSSTSAYDHKVRANADVTRSTQSFDFYAAYYGNAPRPYFDSVNTLVEDGFTQEVRLASRSSTVLEYVVGAYYSSQKSNPGQNIFDRGYFEYYAACKPVFGQNSDQCGVGQFFGTVSSLNNVPVLKDLAYAQESRNRFEDRAIYGQLTWHLSPQLQITGGLRAFSQILETTQFAGVLFAGADSVAFRTSITKERGLLGKADISYQISPKITAYFNWSQGFRRGANNPLPASTNFGTVVVTPAGAFSASPDRVDNFEGGLKGSWRGLTFDASVYDIEWHNIQGVVPVTALFIPSILNVGDGYSRGVDLSVSGFLADHVFAQVNYSFNNSKLKSVSPLVTQVSRRFQAGGRFPGVPQHQLNWRFEYHQDLTDWQLRYGVDGNFRTESYSTISANSATAPGYTMWNLYVQAVSGPMSARLFVDNVANTLGITARANPANLGPDAPYFVTTPRTFGLSVTYAFNTPR